MAGGSDPFSIGTSGLLAFQRGLTTISHNIANVDTEGYSRQRVEFSARPPTQLGNLIVGSGVEASSIQRVYDQFLVQDIRNDSSQFNRHKALADYATRIDELLADGGTGISSVMDSFFNAVQGLADDPASTPRRDVLLSEANNLATRFNFLFERTHQIETSLNGRIEQNIGEVNTLATEIAALNTNISEARNRTGGQQPNDLLDQRDTLLLRLSEFAAISTVEQDDGSVNVSLGKGQALVVGGATQKLTVIRDQYDPTRIDVGYGGTGSANVISSQLTGGSIAGLVDARRTIIDSSYNMLGRVAMGVAKTFNEQHQLGTDLNGNPGAKFFADIAANAPQALPSSQNTGTAAINADITNVGAVTTSDYRLTRTAGPVYTLTRLSDNTSTDIGALGFPGGSVTVDGVTLSLASGAMSDGDTFLIRPTHNAAKDIAVALRETSSIAAAAPIRTAASLGNNGRAVVSLGAVNAPPPPNANLQQTVTITFDNPPTTFDVVGTGTGNPTNVAYTSSGSITYNGWTIQISGAPVAGDVFTVSANTSGVGDNRNALLLADLQKQLTLENGTATYQNAYGSYVANVGTTTRQAEISRDAQQILLQKSQDTRESYSGVNLDEEAADLLKFQQLYQATAKIISIADNMFQSLLDATAR
ncbi:MAG: hypothetical protein FD165_127 [Gammaproteobacteria bacterium]|nr:MAG: hypothetical protein FD165_127 [Gammaproteobacteria bacterium]TND06705.1 MAG: hypothetical protein FD120_437 [Gammaproteobacteria bacterium]